MYRPSNPAHGPPPFGPPPLHGPPYRLGGPCGGPHPGHFPPEHCGPFSASAPPDHRFLHHRPPRGHLMNPHCSSFSIDRSTVIALGGSQQIVPPAQPPHIQVPQWNPTPVERHPPDNSDQAGEEFLRCIAANEPLPDYLKGNMAYNLADAFKSASVLKEAIKSDLEFQKHSTRSKSRSQSRGKSRAKSRGRSKSRAPSRSSGRSKSHARDKSRARSKSRTRSRARSWSRSQSRSKKKSHVRSKSRARRSESQSSSGEKSHGKDGKRKRSPSPRCSNNPTGNSLLEGLKLVMNSKELEERLPTLKDAILTIQASDESKKIEKVPDKRRHQHHDSTENSTSLENDSMLLPHDRVGSDFSWLQTQSQADSAALNTTELEDEESFLYGNIEHANLQEVRDSGSQQHHQNKSIFSSFGDLLDLKQPLQLASSSLASANLDSSECDKIKNILKSLGTADISDIVIKVQGQKEEKQPSPATAASLALPALSNPNVRQALESLQSLIKVTKEKREKSDGSGTSQTSSDKHKGGDDEQRKKEKQARIKKMESLMKELEELVNQDGLSFLIPVIGFYCQKCEEFIGDLNSAENHAAIHRHGNSSSMDKHAGDGKGHFSKSTRSPQPSDRREHRDSDRRDHRDSGEHRNHRDHHRDWRDERDHRSKYHDDGRSHRARQENISLQDEMKKERMLITVSRGLTPPSNVKVKEELSEEQTAGSQSKVRMEDMDSKGKSSKGSREKDGKEKYESSDGSDDDKGKSPKTKSLKKKKKKDKKKKKKGKS